MKPSQNLNTNRLTRRGWLVLTASAAASALTGCGGGGSTLAGIPGTGGTGIYTQGAISGFGSVIMKGVKFDDAAATVKMDGVSMLSSDLRLGMVAGITGERSADATLGTAHSIEVWSIAQGVVTNVSVSISGGEFTVAGMTVQTDVNTVFDGIANAALLAKDQRVVVWGLQAGVDDGIVWKASRLALLPITPALPVTALVSTGLVSVHESKPSLNGLQLTGTDVASLVKDALVRVQGTLSSDGRSLAVSSFKSMAVSAAEQAQTEVEIEGVVTSVAATSFAMGGITVDSSKTIYAPLAAKIATGDRVEVYGKWASGVLVATKVEVEDAAVLQTVEITANIESYKSVADFELRGQRCNATGATFVNGIMANLKNGVRVKVMGTKNGDVLTVTSVQFNP